MTATQSQIREAENALDKLYSAALESEYRTYGDPDEHVSVVRAVLNTQVIENEKKDSE